MFDRATQKRLNACDYNEFRKKHAPWMPETSDPKEQDLLVRLWEPTGARGIDDPIGCGTLLFGKLFFGKQTRKLMSRQRIEYLMALDNQRNAFINMMAHRTFGKTTWMMIFGCRQIAMRFAQHLLYTSSEYKIAARRTETMRRAFISADFIALFGDMRPQRTKKQVNNSFSEDTYFLVDPKTNEPFACISPRGTNQAVNGSIAPVNGEYARVDFILNDDGQPRKNIHNANVRETYEEWLESELFQTVETDEQPDERGQWPTKTQGERVPWRVIMADSCKHRLGVALRWQNKPGWTNLVYPAARMGEDGQWYSAHEIYTNEAVRGMAKRMAPDYFAREFLCQPTSSDAMIYKQTMFAHEDPKKFLEKCRGNVFKFLVVDPSRVGHHKANPTSILAVAVDLSRGGKICYLHNLVDRMEPEIYYSKMFEIAREWGIYRIYIEDTGVSNVLRSAVKTHAQLAGVWNQLEFKWLHSKRNEGTDYGSGPEAIKIARAAAPLPFYRSGLIVHAHSMYGGVLERSYLEWPECSDWGATDTAGYVPEILEEEQIYLEGTGEDAAPFDDDEADDYRECGNFFRNFGRQRLVAA